VLKSAPVALGYYFSSELGAVSTGQLPAPAMSVATLARHRLSADAWSGYGANAPSLVSAARAAGFYNQVVDRDGVVRTLPLLARHGDALYESLAVSVLRLYLGAESLGVQTDAATGTASLLIGSAGRRIALPVSPGASVLVPFQGGASASRFRHVSASDVLQGRIEPRMFRDRVVLLGTSAPSLGNHRTTPVGDATPVVDIHATVIAGALEGALRTRPLGAAAVSAAVIATIGATAAVLMAGHGVVAIAGLTLLGLSTLVAWNAIAFSQLGWVMPLASGVLVLLVIAIVNIVAEYVIEGRARRAVISLFGQYVAPQLVARMTHDPHNVPLESQDKELTILFADIRGFTRMAESMDPQQLRDFLNRFLTAMTEVIHAHDGTVDKYIGDAVMAFWGAPVDDPQHADRAVAAAIAMQDEVARLNEEFETIGLPRLRVGIGINTGVVRVGDMGSRLRRSYTVIGDAVNLAARLEGLSKRFDLPIVIGDATRLAVRSIALQFVTQTDIPGRSESVGVWQPVPLDAHAYVRSHESATESVWSDGAHATSAVQPGEPVLPGSPGTPRRERVA
jgi:adenylate cyclase